MPPGSNATFFAAKASDSILREAGCILHAITKSLTRKLMRQRPKALSKGKREKESKKKQTRSTLSSRNKTKKSPPFLMKKIGFWILNILLERMSHFLNKMC